MKHTHLYWKLGIISCFLIGYVLLSYPFVKNTLIQYKVSHQQEEMQSNFQASKGHKSDFQYDTIQPPSLPDVLSASGPTQGAVGEIVSDQIGLHVLIFPGANQSNLLSGATTISPNQKIGKGNYVLLGHHMKDESLLFSPIMKLKKDDIVYVRDQNKVYRYRIEKTEIVHQSQVSVMEDKGDHRLTLITCDKATLTDRRFIATGFLEKSESIKNENEFIVKSYEKEKENLNTREGSQSYWYAMILGMYVFLCIVLSILLWKKTK
ncbi:class A sortase [Bacillus cereus]|uniref:Sortase n=1 Tax=Bacillus cereus MC67 TaxID=1053219 RepID=J8BAE5_BACCE|nr:class A sortase [Bacillus cereus]EJQ90858.1 sortase [Bacillus cereus MC67]EOO98689.1 sortase [Bacillus cereus MC118]